MHHSQIGVALDALDTPSLLVDLELMEANIARLRERLQGSTVHIRPHLKTVKSPELAHLLLAAGAVGGCVSKVSEAEVMAEAGIEDLLITTEIVGAPKVARLIRLVQQHPRVKVVVDSLSGAQALNQAMQSIQQQLDVLIEINVGQNRCGVEPGDAALALAQQISQLPYLRLIGVQGYEGHLQHVHDYSERQQRCLQSMHLLATTATCLREAGFPLEIVTTGGTGTAEFCASYEGITEIQPGSFIFMDTDYRDALGPGYANALTVLTTVISRPTPQRAIVDAGLKALSTDSGMAQPKDLPGVAYQPLGDEHGLLVAVSSSGSRKDVNESGLIPAKVDLPNPQRSSGNALAIGDRLELIPSHCDTTINLYDVYYAHRHGRVEAVWSIATRGKIQ